MIWTTLNYREHHPIIDSSNSLIVDREAATERLRDVDSWTENGVNGLFCPSMALRDEEILQPDNIVRPQFEAPVATQIQTLTLVRLPREALWEAGDS